jgi:hypothetical protein
VNDRSLIATGGIAAVLAAICCATPILAILLGGIGLTAWIARADYVTRVFRRAGWSVAVIDKLANFYSLARFLRAGWQSTPAKFWDQRGAAKIPL